MRHPAIPGGISREQLVDWFRRGRQRSRRLFEIPLPERYYDRPISLRNPIVFYEGHLPVFTVNTLIKLALRQQGIDAAYEQLFERGIDPEDETRVGAVSSWPSRDRVQAYGAAADALIERALRCERLEDDRVPQLRGGEAALAIIEHEFMHQETLLYMFHNMAYEDKVRPTGGGKTSGLSRSARVAGGDDESVSVPAGIVTIGANRDQLAFGWDNEFPSQRIEVGDFRIGRNNVTNGEYLGYQSATGAAPPHFWLRKDGEWFLRAMFDLIPLPLDWPVYVMHDEADAYARWQGKRLPTEAEYHRAAFGTPSGEERAFPWGDEPADATRGNFDFANWDPVPAGSYPEGASAWGVHDLVGNGWEWTSTHFAGFPGFQPMASYPVYSSDFFDGQHYVLKGASPATARELVRRTFRNWFRPNYPYVFATFRCVS